jgi:hypothetical protein
MHAGCFETFGKRKTIRYIFLYYPLRFFGWININCIHANFFTVHFFSFRRASMVMDPFYDFLHARKKKATQTV